LIVIVTMTPAYARVVRTQTRSVKENPFIQAERSLGAHPLRIIVLHVVPNIAAPLLIIACMDIPGVIAVEAGLSFLGLGVRPPSPSWGTVLQDGYAFVRNTPWLLVAGSIPLIVSTLGFTFLGEALRDWLDPKTRTY
jgi:peptide/nickel transport system permease protein